jgi:hypothetical protein
LKFTVDFEAGKVVDIRCEYRILRTTGRTILIGRQKCKDVAKFALPGTIKYLRT